MALQISSTSTKTSPSSGGLRIGGYTPPTNAKFSGPQNWHGSGEGTVVPVPLSSQEARIAKSFSTLPAQERSDTLGRLSSAAKAGDIGAARKLVYLQPLHDQNVPTDPNYHTAAGDIYNAVSPLVKGVVGSYKTTANTIATVPHAVNAAGIALASMAEHQHGAELAKSKQATLNEIQKTPYGQYFGKTTAENNAIPVAKQGAQIAGQTLENVLNLATPGEGAVAKKGAEAAGAAIAKPALKSEAGFIRNMGTGQFSNAAVHPEDAIRMSQFIDHTRGVTKLSEAQAHQLELDASRIAEHYNIGGGASTPAKLANAFDRTLQSSPGSLSAIKEAGHIGLPKFNTPKAVASSTGQKIVKGALLGGAYGAAQSGEQGSVSNTDLAKNVGIGAVAGGALNGVLDKILQRRGLQAISSTGSRPSSIVSAAPKVTVSDTAQPILNQRAVAASYNDLSAGVKSAAKGMSDKDIKLLEGIETTTKNASYAAGKVNRVAQAADNPTQFKTVVAAMREAYNARHASDKELGRDVGFIHNYLPHIYDKSDKATSSALDRLNLSADSTPGYVKGRVIPTYAEADRLAKEAGLPQLKRANPNVLEDFYQSMGRAASDHGSAVLKRGLEEAHPGVKVGVGKIGFDAESGQKYDQLKIPGGSNLSLPSKLAAKYNARAQPGKATGAVGAYDKANAVAKTSVLGGGTFHALTTAGTVAGQQVVRGITHPTSIPGAIVDNLKLVSGTFNKGAHEANMAAFTDRGVTDFARKTGATLGPAEVAANDVSRTSRHIPIISDIHDAVFKRQIPEAKLTIIEQTMGQKFPKMDFANPTSEQVAYGRQVANQANNLGGINRAVEGLTPRTAKNLSRVLLAPDYTEGKFRTIYNALSSVGPKGNIARQMVVGKTLLFALPGLAALTAAGQIDWSDSKSFGKAITDQILDPSVSLGFNGKPSKTNPGGTPQAVHLPTTFISEIGKIIKPALDSLGPNGAGTDPLAGVKSYATNRVAALPGTAARLAQNKDFYGNPIYGNDATGNPIGAGKTALNIGEQVLPIPAVQGIRQGAGQQDLLTSALNTAGGRVSADTTSAESLKSGDVTRLYNAFDGALTTKTAVAKKVQQLVAENKINQAHRTAQDWNSQLTSKPRNYPDNFGSNSKAAWDTKWKGLEIKTTSRADLTRIKNAKGNAALLNLSQ